MNRARSPAGLSQLFALRNRAVHPSAAFADPSPHPFFKTSMEPRYVAFRVENTAGVIDFVHKLVWLCLHQVRQQDSDIDEWVQAMAQRVGPPAT